MKSLIKFLFSVILFFSLVQAHSFTTTNPGETPGCAKTCMETAIKGGLCKEDDIKCRCLDPIFSNNVTVCVMARCTMPEMMATRNATHTYCGGPIRSRTAELNRTTITMAVLAIIFVAIRFYYKVFVTQMDLGLDDWIILVAVLTALPSALINIYGVGVNGLGKDIWTLTPSQITDFGYYFFIVCVIYFVQTGLVKLSIICFYMRIFPAKEIQRVLWATFAMTALWAFTFTIVCIFQCHPVEYFWTEWDGFHKGYCLDKNAITWSNAGIGIALDLWILAVPLWQLRKLQLHWKKKAGVALMFCVGTFVTIVSILRLQSLLHFASSANTTWDTYELSLWSTIEVGVAIICACLPAFRMVLVRFFPALSGSSGKRSTNGQYQQYGSESRTKTPGTRSHTAQIFTQQRPDSEEDLASPVGIVFQKSYTVQYSSEGATDGGSIVAMEDLDLKATETKQDVHV